MGDVPAGVVPYLVHPWVIGNERLRARAGRRCTRTWTRSAEAVVFVPRARHVLVIVAGAGGLLLVAGTAVAIRRRRRKRTTT